MPRVLLVEKDDLDFAIAKESLLREELATTQKYTFIVSRVRTLKEAVNSLNREFYDLILVDPNLPDAIGDKVIKKIRAGSPESIVIVLLSGTTKVDSDRSLKMGAHDVVFKDILPITLKKVAVYNLVIHQGGDGYSSTHLAHAWRSAVFDNTSDGVVVLDSNNIVLFANRASGKMLSFSCEELVGTKFPFFFSKKTKEISFCTGPGEIRWVEGTLTTVEVGKFNVQSILLRDISERKRYENRLLTENESIEKRYREFREKSSELEESRRVFEETTRARELFLASMSHEIRTPLTSVIGYAELLLSASRPENEVKDALASILKNSNHLLELLDNVLDFSRVEAEALVVNMMPCSPFLIMSEVQKLLGIRARAKGIELRVEYDYPIPEKIMTDPVRIKQILLNLVGNSIKFTDTGFVKVRVRYDATDSSLFFDVRDTGSGIPEKDKEAIFGRFVRSSVKDNGFQGFGLGLYLCRRLAKLLGGSVTLESTSADGTLFSFCLNLDPVLAPRMVDRAPPLDVLSTNYSNLLSPRTVQGTVLLVEDAPDARKLTKTFLEEAGAKVLQAENGQVALDIVADYTGEIDLVLMDMQMPLLGGIETVRRLKGFGFDKPIIAFTAGTSQDDLKKAIRAGCVGYLPKPFSRGELFQVVLRYLASKVKKIEEQGDDIKSILPAAVSEFAEGPSLVLDLIYHTKLRLDRLKKAMLVGDYEVAKSVVHQIKAAGAFGFYELEQAAKEFNQALVNNRQSIIPQTFEALLAAADRVIVIEDRVNELQRKLNDKALNRENESCDLAY